ncbi:sn-glycerol-3-phosphate ABC transporter substrate-binding protein [Williamsoniiplasma luminosum]|uniref:sn-glycerol-3-phosphate ABC transporter substrate-binding protein n=1 Tax=Williamsoniiplasma luminosum TaxID=214888 RepID=A0A2K8NT27_9MOLU|nr:hypothetical protein [Williamsoniiplasma luminosum]ATZ16927.1 sn-glycerol-3-phosphate ABC transporter substrate-binding protein [Williamsoniiplasma luminosum]
MSFWDLKRNRVVQVLAAPVLTIALIVSTGAIVSAWKFKDNAGVVVELMGLRPDKAEAYKFIANRYNKARRATGDLKHEVRVLVTPINNIQNEISSGQPLPNLYMAYGDNVAKFDALLKSVGRDDVAVNMAEAINWDTTYQPKKEEALYDRVKYIEPYVRNNATKGNKLTEGKSLDEITHSKGLNNTKFRPLKDSFIREGTYGEKLYVAPTAKSSMNGIINNRLFKEIIELIIGQKQEWVNVDSYETFNYLKTYGGDNLSWTNVQDKAQSSIDEKDDYKLTQANRFRNSNKNLKELITDFFDTPEITKGDANAYIANAMQDMSVLEVVLTAYAKLLHTQPNNKKFQQTIGMAIDDESGFVYAMQQNLKQKKEIYEWDMAQNSGHTLKLNDQTGADALNQTIDFYRHFAKISKLDSQAGSAGTSDHGYGGLGTKGQDKVYYSDKWVWGGTLTYYGSTAGNPYWAKPLPWTGRIEGTYNVPKIEAGIDHTKDFFEALTAKDKTNIGYIEGDKIQWTAIIEENPKDKKLQLAITKKGQVTKGQDKASKDEKAYLDLSTTEPTKIITTGFAWVLETDISIIAPPGYVTETTHSKNEQEGKEKPFKTVPNFVQQGPGIAMFKNKNQSKNEVAIDFLNYFLQAQNNTDFALTSGYVPSNYYAYFTNVQSNSDNAGAKIENNWNHYMKYIKHGLDETKGGYNPKEHNKNDWPAKVKLYPAKEALKEFVLGVVDGKFKFWTQIPSPFGDLMRFQVIVPWIHQKYRVTGAEPETNMTKENFWSTDNMKKIEVSIRNMYPVDGKLELESQLEKKESK